MVLIRDVARSNGTRTRWTVPRTVAGYAPLWGAPGKTTFYERGLFTCLQRRENASAVANEIAAGLAVYRHNRHVRGHMKRWHIALAFVVSCVASGAAGYWFGFREALPLGVTADFLPRGVIATGHLKALRSGKPENVILKLEYDVDNGLIWGHELFQHPLRNLMVPIWGFNFYPEYEDFAVRLANYRKKHPSLMKPDAFDNLRPNKEQYREVYRELAHGTRENIAKINSMVERYATKK